MSLRLALREQLPSGRVEVDALEVVGTTALVGPSGAGKTTILEIVAGLRRPADGSIALGSDVWLDTAAGIDRPPRERRVGYVPQDLALFPHLSARANVAWGVEGPRGERRRRADALLARFGLAPLAGRRVDRLSGGERRRVAVARALAREPAALLLDEPFTGLDAAAGADARAVVRAARKATGAPTMLVSHDFADAVQIADQVAVLEAGRIVQAGTPGQLAAAPRTAFVAALVGLNALPGTAVPDGALTRIDGPGGVRLWSTDQASGPVLASVHPADIAVSPERPSDAENVLRGRIVGRIPCGPRDRIELETASDMAAEVPAGVPGEPGAPAWISWRAAATRLAAAPDG